MRRKFAIMTQSPYLNDLLATTKVGHYQAPELAELLEDAEEPGAIFSQHFDQFSTDIERRFLQTIGLHKAIAAISGSKDAARLLRGCIANYEFMTETFFACDLRGLPLDLGIDKIIKRLREGRASIQALLLSGDKTAAPLLRLAAHDYTLLIELFEQIRPRASEWRQ
jgi:hypothetical protein